MTYCVIVYDPETKQDVYETEFMSWAECRWFEDYVHRIYPDAICPIFS